MSNATIHSGFVSGFKVGSLPNIAEPWLTTSSDNEVVTFQHANGDDATLNALIIETAVDTFVQILPGECAVLVKVDEPFYYDLTRVKQIKILSPSGVKYRWSGQYY